MIRNSFKSSFGRLYILTGGVYVRLHQILTVTTRPDCRELTHDRPYLIQLAPITADFSEKIEANQL